MNIILKIKHRSMKLLIKIIYNDKKIQSLSEPAFSYST